MYLLLFSSAKPEEVGWQHVSGDLRRVHIRKSRPDAIEARRLPGNNFIALIDEAVNASDSREGTFHNVQIDMDGEIASVAFAYEFLAGGGRTHWGREMWQLVRTEQGWKIFSVVYTARDALSEKAP